MIWDLWYRQLEKEAEEKYKKQIAGRGNSVLPNKMDAISLEKEMREKLEKSDSQHQGQSILKEYLPQIMDSLVVSKYEGFAELSKKEATAIKHLMLDFGVQPEVNS